MGFLSKIGRALRRTFTGAFGGGDVIEVRDRPDAERTATPVPLTDAGPSFSDTFERQLERQDEDREVSLKMYGNYGGPGYSAGQAFRTVDAETGDPTALFRNVQPTDALDAVFRLHDIRYSISNDDPMGQMQADIQTIRDIDLIRNRLGFMGRMAADTAKAMFQTRVSLGMAAGPRVAGYKAGRKLPEDVLQKFRALELEPEMNPTIWRGEDESEITRKEYQIQGIRNLASIAKEAGRRLGSVGEPLEKIGSFVETTTDGILALARDLKVKEGGPGPRKFYTNEDVQKLRDMGIYRKGEAWITQEELDRRLEEHARGLEEMVEDTLQVPEEIEEIPEDVPEEQEEIGEEDTEEDTEEAEEVPKEPEETAPEPTPEPETVSLDLFERALDIIDELEAENAELRREVEEVEDDEDLF